MVKVMRSKRIDNRPLTDEELALIRNDWNTSRIQMGELSVTHERSQPVISRIVTNQNESAHDVMMAMCERYRIKYEAAAQQTDAIAVACADNLPPIKQDADIFEKNAGMSVDVVVRAKGWAGYHIAKYFHAIGEWRLPWFNGAAEVIEWWPLPEAGTGQGS